MTSAMNDDRLLSLLSEMLADSPPPDAMAAAYAAHELRHLDTGLARLMEDLQVEVVGFSGSAPPRTLAYEAQGGTIAVAIDGHNLQLEADPTPRRVDLHRTDVAVELVPDNTGRVQLFDLSGPLRFTIHWDMDVARTPWITL